jgi:hypothetical protein
VELVVGDIGDKELLQKLFAEHAFTAVIHFAAYAYVGESVTDPLKYYRNNTVVRISSSPPPAPPTACRWRSRSPRPTRRIRSIPTAAAS